MNHWSVTYGRFSRGTTAESSLPAPTEEGIAASLAWQAAHPGERYPPPPHIAALMDMTDYDRAEWEAQRAEVLALAKKPLEF